MVNPFKIETLSAADFHAVTISSDGRLRDWVAEDSENREKMGVVRAVF
jgi:hypothetical protein